MKLKIIGSKLTQIPHLSSIFKNQAIQRLSRSIFSSFMLRSTMDQSVTGIKDISIENLLNQKWHTWKENWIKVFVGSELYLIVGLICELLMLLTILSVAV